MDKLFSSGSKQQKVLALVASAQASGENPLEAVDDYLWEQLVPTVPPSLPYQLYAISGILGLCLLFVLVSLAVRLRGKGTFWVMRVSTGGLLAPHWSIGWSLWAVILVIFLQAQIYITIEFLRKEHVVYSYLALRVYPWMAAWMGGWTALWSLTISYCTHRHASGKLQLDTRTAVIVNSLALAFPIAYLGAALSFAIQASITWTQFLDGFKELDLLLKEGAAAYDPATFSILQLASGLPGLQQFYALVDSLVWDVKRVFLTFATAGVVLDAILVTVAYLHLQSLARVISETTTVMDTLESSRSREHALLRSYKNLKWTSISFISICALFTGVCIYTAIETRESFTNSLVLQIALLLPLYVFAILGLPTSILLLVRSLDSLESGSPNPTSSRGKMATSVGVGGKSYIDAPAPVFEMVVPRREMGGEELDEATSKGEIQRPMPVQRDADGWFRQVQEDSEAEEGFSAGATPGLSAQERESIELDRKRESAASKRRSSLWGSKRWSTTDQETL